MTNDGKEFEFGTSVHDKAKYIESLFKNDTTLNTSSVQEGDGVRNQSTPPSFELSNEHDQSIHVRPYADMIEKMSYVQKADFAKAALDYERDAKTLKQMFEEVSRERNAWISEYRAARAEVERLKQERDKHLGRVNGLEEWLTEYRDQLKAENAFHKNTGIINAINELLNGFEGI